MTIRTDEGVVPEVREVGAEEGAELFDRTARELLNMTGAEFLACWDRGEFSDQSDDIAVTKVAMLIPFAR